MLVDQDIIDSKGRPMISRGSVLDDFRIEYLKQQELKGIYVLRDDVVDSTDDESLSTETRELIENTRVEDRAKVVLNSAISKRIGEGIQYLFNNTDDENFVEEAGNMASDLMKTISDNNAVAFDINLLRCSDDYTFKHSVDVAMMSMIIGKNLGLDEKSLRDLALSGLLHDLGKSKIPLEILNKKGKLSEEEFALMKQHSLFGFKILKERNEFNDSILKGVLQHHEKLNGRGYPLGVGKDQIHYFAKIIAVADIYDALVTDRPYKKAYPKCEAVEMLMAMTEELDIDILKKFLKSVILYSVDAKVVLSNGEIARVVANTENSMRPKVVGLKSGKMYDMTNDVSCASIVVVSDYNPELKT
ncbi:MAG: HD-GYP domain-containing protein [Lachnospiraceae bacterium]|nr:HD-GYP domain-containing protein [Lachnospiraceae bacterium]